MKKILRSVINVNGTINKDDLLNNFYTLADSRLEPMAEEDEEIWEWVKDYVRTYTEPPTSNSVRDYFKKENALEVLDRIDEIEAVSKTYTNADFENLVRQSLREQNERDTQLLLRDASHILSGKLKEGNREYQGYKDSIRYVMEHADDLLMADSGQLFRSEITSDTDEMREEFRNTIMNSENAFGRLTGLKEIDYTCRGIKPGELWLHAGFTGHLKCARSSTKVFDHKTKSRRELGELYQSDDLPTVTSLYHEGEKSELVTAEASHLKQNGVRSLYRITLESGKEVEVTKNHPLYVAEDQGTWKKVENIHVGDWVGVPSKTDVPNPRDDFSDEEVKTIGYLIGDGSLKEDRFAFHASNKEIREDFVSCLQKLGYSQGEADYKTPNFRIENEHTDKRSTSIRISRSMGNGNSDMISPLFKRLSALGLIGTKAKSKYIPDELYGLSENQISYLLGALWSTDGSISSGDYEREDRESPRRNNCISYSSTSKELVKDIQSLLLRLGIQSKINKNDMKYKDEDYHFWELSVVTNKSKRKFCNTIKVVGKQDRIETLQERLRDFDNRRYPTELIDHLDDYDRVQRKNKQWRYAGQAQKRETITAESLKLFSELDSDLMEHIQGDVEWERVDSIEYIGEEMTYDLSVPEHHSFVADDIITHNTSFALCWAYKSAIGAKYNVYYYSLEMPVEQIRRIIYVMHSNHPKFKEQGHEPLSYPEIRDGLESDGTPLSDEKQEFYKKVIDDIEQGVKNNDYGKIFVECPDEPKTTISTAQSRIELVHQNDPIQLVFLDYLGLMSSSRQRRTTREELNSIFRDAKQMCLTFNQGERIPVVALHQINREGKKKADKNNGEYKLQALAGSSAAERTADVISYSYLDDSMKQAGPGGGSGQVKIGCLKNRDNPQFDTFMAHVHFPSRYISNLQNDTGQIGLEEEDFLS